MHRITKLDRIQRRVQVVVDGCDAFACLSKHISSIFSGKILKFEQKNEEKVDMDEGQMTCSGSDMIGDDLNLDSSNIIPEAAMQCGILPLQQTEDISQDIGKPGFSNLNELLLFRYLSNNIYSLG